MPPKPPNRKPPEGLPDHLPQREIILPHREPRAPPAERTEYKIVHGLAGKLPRVQGKGLAAMFLRHHFAD